MAAGCDKQPRAAPPPEAPPHAAAPGISAPGKAQPVSPPGQLASAVGSYVGMFGKNKMTLFIDAHDPSAGTIIGRSVTAGNDRPFAGTAIVKAGQLLASVKEPGDHADDGIFELTFASQEVVSGTWTPSGKGTAKQFTLTRRTFAYDEDAGQYARFSKEKVSQDDISDMSIGEVRIALNEIYARHGYNFKNKDMRRHFDTQDWYMPMHHDVRKDLTEIEAANIATLTKYKKFMEEYGEDFGR